MLTAAFAQALRIVDSPEGVAANIQATYESLTNKAVAFLNPFDAPTGDGDDE